MITQFSITVDPVRNTAEVLQNDAPVSPFSTLSICQSDPVESWISDLPAMLCREANGTYQVSVCCSFFHTPIFTKLLKNDPQCEQLDFREQIRNFPDSDRILWAEEAASAANCPISPVPVCSVAVFPALEQTARSAAAVSRYRSRIRFCADSCAALHLLPDAGCLTWDPQTPGHTVICIRSGSPTVEYLGMTPVYSLPEDRLSGFLDSYYEDKLLRPWLNETQQKLTRHLSASAPFELRSRITMLTQDSPCVRLSAQLKTEVGCPVAVHFSQFPDTPLTLSAEPEGIIWSDGGALRGRAPGRTTLRVLDRKSRILAEQEIEIYTVCRVSQIRLAASGGTDRCLVGKKIRILSDFRPKNAENIGAACWSSDRPSVLRSLGGGYFEAVGSGTCQIRCTVEKCTASISITVYEAARDIRLPQEISVRLHSRGDPVPSQLIPAGSACAEIRCSTSDPGIARWDPATTSVQPITEGQTSLCVDLVGEDGSILCHRAVPITVLPEKDIITPTPMQITSILGLLFGVLTWGTPFSILALLLSACSGVGALCQLRTSATAGSPAGRILRRSFLCISLVSAVLEMVLLSSYG